MNLVPANADFRSAAGNEPIAQRAVINQLPVGTFQCGKLRYSFLQRWLELPRLHSRSEPADAGAAVLSPLPLTTELPAADAFQQNSKLQELISGNLSRYVDRKAEQTAVEAFYQARNYQPLWTGSPEASKRAEAAIAFATWRARASTRPITRRPIFRQI